MNFSVAIKSGMVMGAVWFATHCGGGFATGNQEVHYFVKYGWYSLILPIFSMLILGWSHRNALVLAKDHKVYNYKDYSDVLFHPYEKYFSWIFELGYLLLFVCATSGAIAGSGALLESALNIPYMLAITLIGASLIVLTIFGSSLIIKVLSFKTYFLIATLLLVCFLGISAGFDNLKVVISAKETYGTSFTSALWDSIIYVGFQTFTVMPIISVAERIKTTKECNWFMVIGTFLNGFFLVLVCIMLLAFSPASIKETLPVYFVTTHLDYAWLKVVYSAILFIALIGSAVSLMYSAVARFEIVLTKKNIFSSLRMRRIFISTFSLIICTGISVFGLTKIVVTGYGALGYVGIFFVLIPQLVVGTIKISKNAAKRKAAGIIE